MTDREAVRPDAPGRTQSLYRKYRPTNFDDDELVGQEHVRSTLRNAILRDRVAHAYLFCGPRGTGKTSTARLLAKAVNCLEPDPARRPCNQCEACIAINQARTTDVIEIDAASNRGIEDIRDLREQVKYAPTQLRHKFYIIDEAHRLTRDAFNAFLKTLEEPPPNTTFVLATTDPEELPETVASRCQRFDFHRIPADQMATHVRSIAMRESITIDDEAIAIIVRQATGSLRDALSTLDMLATAAGEEQAALIDANVTRRMLGLTQDERTLGLITALLERDVTAALRVIGDAVDTGVDMRTFGRQITTALRLMLLARAGAAPAEADERTRKLAERTEIPELLRLNRVFAEVDFAIRNSGFPQLPLELAAVEAVVGSNPSVAEGSPSPPAQPRSASTAEPPNDWLSTMGRSAPANQSAPAEQRPAPQRASPPPEPRQAAPADLSTPAEGDVEIFVAAWPRVRTEVKALDRKVEALLASTDPHSIDDGVLTLVAAYPFHAGKLNEAKTRGIIEDAIERATGQKVTVSAMLRGDAQRPTPPPSRGSPAHRDEEPRAPEPAPSTHDNGRGDDDEVVRRFAAILDAEEIDLREISGYEDTERRLG